MGEVNQWGEELCDFTEIPKNACVHCLHSQPVDDDPFTHPDGAFKARLEGVCWGTCGEDIVPGDMIVMVETDGYKRYAHQECVGD